jgi:hypothetical protein
MLPRGRCVSVLEIFLPAIAAFEVSVECRFMSLLCTLLYFLLVQVTFDSFQLRLFLLCISQLCSLNQWCNDSPSGEHKEPPLLVLSTAMKDPGKSINIDRKNRNLSTCAVVPDMSVSAKGTMAYQVSTTGGIRLIWSSPSGTRNRSSFLSPLVIVTSSYSLCKKTWESGHGLRTSDWGYNDRLGCLMRYIYR